MYAEHTDFIKPDDSDAKIWKFMDFTKLVNLLETKSLYFTRADQFDDPFEGSFTKYDIKHVQTSEHGSGIKEAMLKNVSDIQKFFPKTRFINCWSLNEYESSASWKIFTSGNQGIAIQSTFDRLVKSFGDTPETIHIGKIKYVDYENESFGVDSIVKPFLYKRKSFEHERELRAIIDEYPTDLVQEEFEKITKRGINAKVKLDVLVKQIFVAPAARLWFKDLVKSVIRRYNLNVKVVDSTLDERPGLI